MPYRRKWKSAPESQFHNQAHGGRPSVSSQDSHSTQETDKSQVNKWGSEAELEPIKPQPEKEHETKFKMIKNVKARIELLEKNKIWYLSLPIDSLQLKTQWLS